MMFNISAQIDTAGNPAAQALLRPCSSSSTRFAPRPRGRYFRFHVRESPSALRDVHRVVPDRLTPDRSLGLHVRG